MKKIMALAAALMASGLVQARAQSLADGEEFISALKAQTTKSDSKRVKDGPILLHPFGNVPDATPSKPKPAPAPQFGLGGADAALVDLIAKVSPSVVVVKTSDGLGSGYFISSDGLIATNAHVVEGSSVGDEVDIVTSDKKTHKGVVAAVGDHSKRGKGKDMAFVSLDEKDKKWPAVEFSDGKSVAPGRFVLALGHPHGLDYTATTGIVSAVDRHLDDSVLTFIQTNAAINPGNSGGPLFDLSGKVIGMDTQIMTQGGGSEGLGFAIEASEVLRGIEQYKRTGNLETGYLGASLLYSGKQHGLTIEATSATSPAGKAGFKAGDLIVSVDGQAVPNDDSDEALRVALHAMVFKSSGESVAVVAKRGGKDVKATVALGKWPKPLKGVIASLDNNSSPTFGATEFADAAPASY